MKQAIKGDIIFTPDINKLECYKDSYLVYENGQVDGIYSERPADIDKCIDHTGALIIPGFNDVHLHAPQWQNCGIGYSMELLPWLDNYTFPLEAGFSDIEFAKNNYRAFLKDMIHCGTTRACVFATIHSEATKFLIEEFRSAGIGGFIGKVNMDRNSNERLTEETNTSLKETEELINWVEETRKDDLVNYILTPRFVPSTTTELMKGLGKLADKYELKVQSHLCENPSEIEWVRSLHPECEDFTSVYYDYGLMPKDRTIMAHCIHNTEKEQALLKKQGVYVAHCAASNMNLSSGIMPLRKYLNDGQKVGIASDISAGETLDMRRNIVSTIQASKLYWREHEDYPQISFTEAFYLATKGSGSFFGQVGSFQKGYDMDALVIEDGYTGLTLAERLEKYVYTGSCDRIIKRFVRGKEIQY